MGTYTEVHHGPILWTLARAAKKGPLPAPGKDLFCGGKDPVAVQDQVEEDKEPHENAGPVMEIGDQRKRKDNVVEPGYLEEILVLQQAGNKTDQERNPHKEVNEPFYLNCGIHRIFFHLTADIVL